MAPITTLDAAAPLDVSAALAAAESKFKSTLVDRPVPFEIDLGHLCAYDVNVLESEPFVEGGSALEDYLRANARDGVQAIINQLWEQPTRPSEDGTTVLADLPQPTTTLPRSKPLPKAKPATRWERFAKEKGIHKTKKSRLVYSEQEKDWIPSWGYQGANNQEDWVIEVPQNADPMEDQFEKLREEKRERVSKNKKQQQRNEDRAAGTIKAGTVDPKAAKLQRKSELSSAIAISKSSTASLGKFDRKLDNEGVVKIRASKRSFDAVSSGDIAKEKEMASKVLKKVVEGSGSIKTGKRAGTTTLQEEERPQKKGRKGVSGGKKRK